MLGFLVALVTMDSVLIFFIKYVVFIIVAIAAVYWLTLPKKQKIQMLVFGLVLAAIAFILTRIGSALYYDARPFVDMGIEPLVPHDNNNGFPSDHTALAFSAAAAIFYMNKKLGAITLALALAVGLSRVIGHIHSLTDIIGSIVFVAISYAVAYYVTPKITQRLFAPKSKE